MAIIKCPECGKDISSLADECIHCGVKLRTCPMCGAVTGGADTCEQCGHKFKTDVNMSDAEVNASQENYRNAKPAAKHAASDNGGVAISDVFNDWQKAPDIKKRRALVAIGKLILAISVFFMASGAMLFIYMIAVKNPLSMDDRALMTVAILFFELGMTLMGGGASSLNRLPSIMYSHKSMLKFLNDRNAHTGGMLGYYYDNKDSFSLSTRPFEIQRDRLTIVECAYIKEQPHMEKNWQIWKILFIIKTAIQLIFDIVSTVLVVSGFEKYILTHAWTAFLPTIITFAVGFIVGSVLMLVAAVKESNFTKEMLNYAEQYSIGQ